MPRPSDHTASTRRTFLKQASLSGTFFSLAPTLATAAMTGQPAADLPTIKSYKRLGSTDIKLADVSFGGSRLRRDVALVEHALARGINYFDTAESYTGGSSEKTIGKALQGKRHQVYAESLGVDAYFNKPFVIDKLVEAIEGLCSN